MKNIKLLLVDDEEALVMTISERLSMRGINNDIACDGQQALDLISESAPDVVVLDLKMPGIDGMELLRRIKDQYGGIEVIMLTGHGTDVEETEARQLGVFDYLKKPADIEILAKCIKAAYEKKKS